MPDSTLQEGRLAGDVCPYLRLIGAAIPAGTQRFAHPLHLLGARLAEQGPAGGTKVPAAIRPAPLLDTGDGNNDLLADADQDREVQDPVLLGAHQLVAVHQQDLLARRVLERQLGNPPLAGDLGHVGDLALERLVEQQVIGRPVQLVQERKEREVEVDLRRTEFEPGERFLDFPYSLHERLLR